MAAGDPLKLLDVCAMVLAWRMKLGFVAGTDNRGQVLRGQSIFEPQLHFCR